MKIRLFFAWFDLWVGFYWDRRARVLYVAPLPCFVFKVEGLTARRDLLRQMRHAEYERTRLDCGQCGHLREYHNRREGCICMLTGLRQCQCTWSGEGINLAVYHGRIFADVEGG